MNCPTWENYHRSKSNVDSSKDCFGLEDLRRILKQILKQIFTYLLLLPDQYMWLYVYHNIVPPAFKLECSIQLEIFLKDCIILKMNCQKMTRNRNVLNVEQSIYVVQRTKTETQVTHLQNMQSCIELSCYFYLVFRLCELFTVTFKFFFLLIKDT